MKKVIVFLFSSLLSFSAFCAQLELIINDQSFFYTEQQLLDIQPSELKTLTPWTDGEPVFKGIELTSLLDLYNISSGTLKLTALNDYVISVDINNLIEANAFIAMNQDGKKLRVRNKGPFWIIFPWSKNSDLINSEVISWAIWQLKSVEYLEK